MSDKPSKTIVTYHHTAVWWDEYGRDLLRERYPNAKITDHPPERDIRTPPHPTPTSTSNHAAVSMVFFEKTSFMKTSLRLDRNLGSNFALAPGAEPDDEFMGEIVIIYSENPLSSIDLKLITRLRPHAYIIAIHMETLDVLVRRKPFAPTGKWMQCTRTYGSLYTICKRKGWSASADPIFRRAMPSESAEDALEIYAACRALHTERIKDSSIDREIFDEPLPDFALNDLCAIHYFIDSGQLNLRTSIQVATRLLVVRFTLTQLKVLLIDWGKAEPIPGQMGSITCGEVVQGTKWLLDEIDKLYDVGQVGMGGTLGVAFQEMYLDVFVRKDASLARRLRELTRIWSINEAELNPFINPIGRRNTWFFFLGMVKLTITEIQVRAQNKPTADIATAWTLEDPMTLVDSDAISDLCANTGLKNWIGEFIDAYDANTDDREKLFLKNFFDDIVLPMIRGLETNK